MGPVSGPPMLLDPVLGFKANGSCVRNQFSRVRRQDLELMGPASRPKVLESKVSKYNYLYYKYCYFYYN
jgi:hypothetical protein